MSGPVSGNSLMPWPRTTGQTTKVRSSGVQLAHGGRLGLGVQRLGAPIDLVQEHRGLVVEQRRDPSAAFESAAAVLVRLSYRAPAV